MTASIYQSRGLAAHAVDDSGDLILHDTDTGELVVLNAVGAAAYELVNGARTSADIAEELATMFPDVPPARIAEDVDTFLRDLARRKLLVHTGP